MPTYADRLPSADKLARQRKQRILFRDVREHDAVTDTLLGGHGYTVQEKPMIVGDWGWDLRDKSYLTTHLGYVRFLIERKTLADLRDTERLTSQLARARSLMHREQIADQTYFVVLVEYKFDTDFKRKWSDEAIRHAKLSIQVGGVRVTECAENGLADALMGLYEWSQKSKHELMGG